MTFPQGMALLVALVGCVTDVKYRRLPNTLTLGAAAGACGYFLAGQGLSGLGWSLAGWAIGLMIFLPLFALRGLGGGDVKLVAAIGAWLGPTTVLWVAAFSALAGGPLALLVALSRGYLRQAIANLWGLLTYWRAVGLKPHPTLTLDTPGTPRLPYAVPILAGLMVTLWLRS